MLHLFCIASETLDKPMSIRPRNGDHAPGTVPSTLEAISAYFFGKMDPQDLMGPPMPLTRDHDFGVVGLRGNDVFIITFASRECAFECLRRGGNTRRFIAHLDHRNGTWTEAAHTGDCPAADERMRTWLRKELEALKQ